jgi:hypothetical protein
MMQTFNANNHTDAHGNPAGGVARATGIEIHWQDGPLGRGEDRKMPNGAFVETVIAIARVRLEFYQEAAGGRFYCAENETAIEHLNAALAALAVLDDRTKKREARGVEGTHAV